MTEQRVVTVLRLNSGEDILAILRGEREGVIMVEHPHFVRMNPMNQTVAMMPYCSLSDEKYFEIGRAQVSFVVTASGEISRKFLKMVDVIEQGLSLNVSDESLVWDDEEETLSNKTYLNGNETKH